MRKITTEMVENILVNFHNSGEWFDDDSVFEIKRKMNNNEDVTLNDFIKAWAYAYDFERYFDTRKDESVKEVAEDFIENNSFDYLEMLENEEYRKFVDDIIYAIE